MTGLIPGNLHVISKAPTITTSAYGVNDNIGGKLELTDAVLSPGEVSRGGGLIQQITIIDKAAQAANIDALLFDAEPAATFTDNAAMPDLDADAAKLIDDVAVFDWKTEGGLSLGRARDLAIPLPGARRDQSVGGAGQPGDADLCGRRINSQGRYSLLSAVRCHGL